MEENIVINVSGVSVRFNMAAQQVDNLKEYVIRLVKKELMFREFLEMPIKNYSSGMAARLGFAIATMVRPDILICDEALSVGDFLFQKKCEERMRQMLAAGTTLLYVSHDMQSVMHLCSHALWLEKGSVVRSGKAKEVCEEYGRQ